MTEIATSARAEKSHRVVRPIQTMPRPRKVRWAGFVAAVLLGVGGLGTSAAAASGNDYPPPPPAQALTP